MSNPNNSLLDAFRTHYHRLKSALEEAHKGQTDSTVLQRLGDDLEEYWTLLSQNSLIFEEHADELETLTHSLALMQGDLRILLRQALDESHQGHPVVMEFCESGNPGRPKIHFDPGFLAWASQHRTQSGLARFLGVSRTTLHNALIEHGIIQPHPLPIFSSWQNDMESESFTQGESSVEHSNATSGEDDDLLEPNLPITPEFPSDVYDHVTAQQQQQAPGMAPGPSNRFAQLTEAELDSLIFRLRQHYRRAGITMLEGMLRRLGYHVQREHIRASLLRIDPVRRVFERIRIRRRVYSVAGPNALWHHDGQHGLIRWGIVIHGFIDGYSRLIVGLRASDNNSADTVLHLFLDATFTFGIPSRMRGDHGTENLFVAAWMEEYHGTGRGSYIWGRSIHNVRIERLWVDITAQIGATWADNFMVLELHHGLNVNSNNHLWLLHHLFLPAINSELTFFAESWNLHKIQIRDGPNRSPADMFGFDMLVHGVRGHTLDDVMSEEELEVYGIDWQGLRDERILHSQSENNPENEGTSSWFEGSDTIPGDLNEVMVEPPNAPLTLLQIDHLNTQLAAWAGLSDEESVIQMWIHGLALARSMNNSF